MCQLAAARAAAKGSDERTEVVDPTHSGDGTLANIGIQMAGRYQCPECRQRFCAQTDEQLHCCFFHDAAGERNDSAVRWMASGGDVCSVPIAPNMRVAEVKAYVQQRAGVPVEEQRLFVGGQELAMDADISPAVAAAAGGVAGPGLELVRTTTDPLATDLGHFRPAPGRFEAVPAGQFTMVRKLATGIHGDVFRYRWQRAAGSAEEVAIKRLRNERLHRPAATETDDRKAHLHLSKLQTPCLEDALTEIGVLKYLAKQADLPRYLLRMRGVFADDSFTWLVTEHAEGGELFNEIKQGGPLEEPRARRFAWELLQAVSYLDRHHIGHRDISLENVLVKDGELRLMDFGMAVRSRTPSGTALRYFRAVGKDFYRAPECYVPASATADLAAAPAGAAAGEVVTTKVRGTYLCDIRLPADVVPGQPCKGEVWGYAAPPADVFAAGVCIFILLCGCPPWATTRLSDAYFAYVLERGIGELLRQWKLPALPREALELLQGMLGAEPGSRPTAAGCLASPWLADLAKAAVPTHGEDDFCCGVTLATLAVAGA